MWANSSLGDTARCWDERPCDESPREVGVPVCSLIYVRTEVGTFSTLPGFLLSSYSLKMDDCLS